MSKRPRRHGLCKCGQAVRALGQRYCRACHNAAMKKHRQLGRVNPEQMKRANVRSYATTYKSRGILVQEPCMLCGSADSQMHHPDYSKPLEVLWMCRAHHEDLHAGRVVLLAYRHQPAVKVPRKIRLRDDPKPSHAREPFKRAA